MDVVTTPATAPRPGASLTGSTSRRRQSLAAWSTAALFMNCVLVVTGAIVRLTDSGLGCPTWPRCNAGELVPRTQVTHHTLIEFGNRMLTFVLTAIVVMVLVEAYRSHASRTEKRLAWYGLVGIPLEAVVGGIVVLSHLNPWLVGLHLLLSVWLIVVYTELTKRTRDTPGEPATGRLRTLVRACFWWMMLTIWLGTVTTGSGPNSGAPGVHRNHLAILTTAKVHAAAVWVAIALTLAVLVTARRAGRRATARWAMLLLVAEMLQGLVGYLQYYNGLPLSLVVCHMAGLGLIATTVAWLWVGTDPRKMGRPAA